MALTSQELRGRRWSRWHLLLRLAGLTGLVIAVVGLVLLAVDREVPSVPAGEAAAATEGWERYLPESMKELGEYLAIGGGVVAGIVFLIELRLGLYLLAGRRGAVGTNVVLQTALAAALLVGANFFSFSHYLRFDWTAKHLFTLDNKVRQDLANLRGETTIVVYQLHKSFGQLSDKPDMYDYAAERKVVEKVRDLVDQFRELGPQFRVIVLDVEEEGFNEKLMNLTKEAKPLRDAIDEAPENSVFFYADGKVQRLSFQDICELDKQESEKTGNLVLLDQGVGPFASKLLNVDEKRPRVAVATIHEVLSMEGPNEVGSDLGMRGVMKALNVRGLDTRDILLKKWNEFTGPEPAVFTANEGKYDRLEEDLTDLDMSVKSLEEGRKDIGRLIELWTKSSLDDLNKKYADQLEGRKLTEAMRDRQLTAFKQDLAMLEIFLSQQREERAAVQKEKAGLNVDSISEQRRMADLKAKTDRLLADCDLLILPRLTLINAPRNAYIPNSLYYLDEAQVAAIKDFLKAGKPILALFGPPNEPANARFPPTAGPDRLEDLLTELGFRLPKQTVLFNAESKSFAERRGNLLILGKEPELPPVQFDWSAGAGQTLARGITGDDKEPSPIRVSMRVNTRSLGKDQKLDLALRHPRPVYYEAAKGAQLPFDPVFMMTDAACWNEKQPFGTPERTPRYEPTKEGDPAKGTRDEERLGPFPIGVAAETTLPASWYTDKDAKPATVRLAVIGHGGVFVGKTLPPVKEKLLLDVCNWLLGRDDLLTKDKPENHWQYPRVALTPRDELLWQWGTRLGLPVLFAYLGIMVLLVRLLR